MAKDRLGFNYTSDEERRIAELEAQLADARKAATWVPIDEEHLPKVGDEVISSFSLKPRISAASLFGINKADMWYWKLKSYTHYRPIGAPQPERKEKP